MPITRQIQAYCKNLDCDMRDVTMNAKWHGAAPPATPCPWCKATLKVITVR